MLKNVAFLTECSHRTSGAGYLLHTAMVRKLLKSDWDVASYFFQSVRIVLYNLPFKLSHQKKNPLKVVKSGKRRGHITVHIGP